MMDQEHVVDLTASYALGALAPEQARRVEAHCAACAACAADMAEMTGLASTLPLVCDPVAPSALLKRRILAAARNDLSAGRLLRQTKGRPGREPVTWWMGAAAALFVGAAGLGAIVMTQHARMDAQAAQMAAQDARLADAQRRLAESRRMVAAIAGGRVWDMSGGPKSHWWHCTIVQPPDKGKPMLVALMPAVPKGKTFQAWIIRGGAVHDGGTVPGGTTTMMHLPMPVERGDVVAFTVEPMGGSATPTMPAAMQAQLE